MKIAGIDFPKPLIDALNDKKLVIFAGAGVSIPEPAGLPSFSQLVAKIAWGSGETQKEETEDRFLGRLHHEGQQVHTQAAQILQEGEPQPSCLHHDILSLYRDMEYLSIVTTNFDTLFEEAAKGKFGEEPETFRAPALPLGSDFNGIVHVHGSIDKPKDMVLTDADFGRAYLTEGWARGFLLDLFRTFPVLFIGYGHNDTVMNYLARALPTDQTPRFALVGEAEENNWNILGVKPLVFPQLSKDDYSGLYNGVAGLAKYATRGILDWQNIITEIAKNPPPLNQEDMDTIRDALSHPTRTRFFTNAASDAAWIPWLDENGHLDNLFGASPKSTMEETSRLLGWWLASTFAKEQSDELFQIVGKHAMDINPEFWETLAWVVGSPEHSPEQAETLSRWVSLLLETAPPRPGSHFLLWLGERCTEAQLWESLLDIFLQMSAVRIQIRERITYSQDDPGPRTTLETTQIHPQWELNKLWEEGLKPNLNHLAEPLLSQIVNSFSTQHRTLCAWQAATRDWDPDRFGRRAIEAHEQDAYPQSVDVLIDAARDSLEYLAAEQPQTAVSWCNRLIKSEVPLLRRLAVHATRALQDLTPSTKIDWVLNTIGLHDRSVHHELFELMREAYPYAGPKQRQATIEEVSKFDLPEHHGEEITRIIAYQHFTWFTRLSDSDPSCGLVRDHAERILAEYPEFKPQDSASFQRYFTSGSCLSPWSTDELLSKPAKEWAPDLLSFEGQDFPDPRTHEMIDRVGLCNAVREAANRDFNWGLELSDALAQEEAWETDLWPALMRTWARQQEEAEQSAVLDRLIQDELQKKNADGIAHTLMALLKEGNLSHHSDLLSRANQVAVTAWDSIVEAEEVGAIEDWYEKAINHPAGMLAEFWMFSLSAWYNEQDPRPQRISAEYVEFMNKIVREDSTAGTLAKSAMARQLRFLTSVDEQWVIEHLIPLFDSEIKDDSTAVWEGSFYDGIGPATADILKQPFLHALSDMDQLFPEGRKSREYFVGRFTTLVTQFVDNPLELWIPSFFAKANEEDRRQFAVSIGDNLRLLENGPQQALWDRWLREYWENRINGTPAVLYPSETRIMFYWLAHLHDLFPTAVELAVNTPNLPSDFSPSTHLRNNKAKAESYPEATAKLLIFWAAHDLPRHAWLGGEQLLGKLLNQHLPEDIQHRLEEIQVEMYL